MECVVEGNKEYMLLGFFLGMVECTLGNLASPIGKLSGSRLDSSSSGEEILMLERSW